MDNFMTQKLTLVKSNSQEIENIKASVQDKIYIKDTSIPVEEGDIFEYENPAGIIEYLEVVSVIYNEHSRLGHIKIEYRKTEKSLKIYLDTNIVSRANDFRINDKDAKALRLISEKIGENKVSLFTSKKAKKEIERTKPESKKNFLLFIYNMIEKIPNSNLIQVTSGAMGTSQLGTSAMSTGSSSESFLFTQLKNIFDNDDAEHIFQAEKSNMDYFLTLDKKSIINRVSGNHDEFRKIGLNINLVLPSDLLEVLNNK